MERDIAPASLLSMTREERQGASPTVRHVYTKLKLSKYAQMTIDYRIEGGTPPKGCSRCGELTYHYCKGIICGQTGRKEAILCRDCELRDRFCVKCCNQSFSKIPSGCAQCGSVAEMECGNCGMAYYCSKKCQQLHWIKQHNNDCTKFRRNVKMQPCQGARSVLSLTWAERRSASPPRRELYTKHKLLKFARGKRLDKNSTPLEGCCRCGEPSDMECKGNLCANQNEKHATMCEDCVVQDGLCPQCDQNSGKVEMCLNPTHRHLSLE